MRKILSRTAQVGPNVSTNSTEVMSQAKGGAILIFALNFTETSGE